ncbi:YlbF family regulator [Halalkalibacter akibai]|uniref:ComK regulator n=1 Tax=Halalkalibacter akibai (strain ATCC 43226 / DSM 21942 / CIP 109018 / JCM 9157 / 1139) TaxID=1236973 RepID=W4QNZ3_HALA3|nr:YlbF family regulator [Halalkalibacter akibai]GAE33830.1 ComK regulator [Halalkalibacter akibai JCM 9157]
MLATITTIELLDHASELGEAIIQSETYLAYIEAKADLKADKEAQERIRQFNMMKDQYEEVQRFGKYHPDYDQISTNIRKSKREVDLTETVVAFKKAEKELESLLNEISGLIARSVSETIKVPTGNPFFDNMSCSGGCSTGGGCGCG